MTDTMRIWDAVSKTDPDHTKQVNQRGGFTAINANYQIMEATRQFGPVGIGWGYVCEAPIFHEGLVIVPVTLWHGDRSNTFGPILGCEEIAGKRLDSDAPKKAMTDAITKGLSQLGFNADVFLGKYDDQKYVNELRAEKQQEQRDPRKIADGLIRVISACETYAKIVEAKGGTKFSEALQWLDEHDKPKANEVTAAIRAAEARVSNGQAPQEAA